VGQHIDMSMMDATFTTDDRAHFEMEDALDTLPICPIFNLTIGQMFVATDLKLLFRRLSRRCGLADPTPAGANLATKITLRENAVEQFLERCKTVSEFAELMDKIDIPWGEVRDPRNLELQPTLKSREMIVQVDDRAGGTRPMAQSPYRFSNASSGVRGPAAHRGENNRVVLKEWLDLTDVEIDGFVAEGLMHAADTTGEG
jgi:crotonobetainyl-CoA:carnitine CoA-transferase CaiB-like acyl-CoA transferase